MCSFDGWSDDELVTAYEVMSMIQEHKELVECIDHEQHQDALRLIKQLGIEMNERDIEYQRHAQ